MGSRKKKILGDALTLRRVAFPFPPDSLAAAVIRSDAKRKIIHLRSRPKEGFRTGRIALASPAAAGGGSAWWPGDLLSSPNRNRHRAYVQEELCRPRAVQLADSAAGCKTRRPQSLKNDSHYSRWILSTQNLIPLPLSLLRFSNRQEWLPALMAAQAVR